MYGMNLHPMPVSLLPPTLFAMPNIQCASLALVEAHARHALATLSLLVAAWQTAVRAHLVLQPAATMPAAQVGGTKKLPHAS